MTLCGIHLVVRHSYQLNSSVAPSSVIGCRNGRLFKRARLFLFLGRGFGRLLYDESTEGDVDFCLYEISRSSSM